MATVTLKLSLGSFSVEVTGPTKYAEKKLEELASRYLAPSRQLSTEQPTSAIATKTGGKKLSPAEFLGKAAHKNQRDRALILAYYLERVEAMTSFTTAELGALGPKTKYPFSNVSDSVLKLVSRGLIMNAGEKDDNRAYALTASGEEYVESMLEMKSQRSKRD